MGCAGGTQHSSESPHVIAGHSAAGRPRASSSVRRRCASASVSSTPPAPPPTTAMRNRLPCPFPSSACASSCSKRSASLRMHQKGVVTSNVHVLCAGHHAEALGHALLHSNSIALPGYRLDGSRKVEGARHCCGCGRDANINRQHIVGKRWTSFEQHRFRLQQSCEFVDAADWQKVQINIEQAGATTSCCSVVAADSPLCRCLWPWR